MATIKICDICQEPAKTIQEFNCPASYEPTDYFPPAHIEVNGIQVNYIPKNIDLCQKCAKKIMEYMDVMHKQRLTTWDFGGLD